MNERIVVHPPKKDKNEKYYVTVSYYLNGSRKQKRKTGFKKSAEAKAEGLKIRQKLEEEMPVIKATGVDKITFETFALQIIDLKSSSWSSNTERLRKHSLTYCDFKDTALAEITSLEIETNIVKLKETYSYNTITSIIGSWNLFFNMAIKYNYLIRNPNISKLEKPKEDKKIKALTIDEVNELYDKIENPTLKLFTLIAFSCGLRRGELLDVNLSDFDFTKGTLSVNHQYSRTRKGYARNQPLKTQNSYRTIPTTKRIATSINNHKLISINGDLFTGNLITLYDNANALYAKLGYDITCHNLRHTYITNLIIGNQFDIQSIAKLAGDKVETILKDYSHYLAKTQEENIKKIENLFG